MGTEKGIPYSFPFWCPWFPFKTALQGTNEKACQIANSRLLVFPDGVNMCPMFRSKSPSKTKSNIWLLLLCYCSYLPPLPFPHFPFKKPFKRENGKGAVPKESLFGNKIETTMWHVSSVKLPKKGWASERALFEAQLYSLRQP